MLTHENKKFNYYLKPNHEVVFGDTTIWTDYFDSSGTKKMNLYFSNIPKQPNHDVKWDGIYIHGVMFSNLCNLQK
ncbi:hypothetical protein [Spiroplasma endosymbiont of Lasioglossum malachurum]|uniref:hypothetical protein n=1 Tax=Spiroplasma endosymbiont of Lasioglossum malachurum TaxID=3066319 RepID=UPI0030CF6E88